MRHFQQSTLFQLLLALSTSALPTLYEYYRSDGISSGLSVDQPYFTLNGKNITIYSGAMHYFRVPPQYWQDRLRKLRASGLNAVETYVPWNLHEPRNGFFDFGDGGTDMEQFLNLETFFTLAKEEDLLVIVRPGPYICAEWEWGGFPSWLLQENGILVRTSDSVYMKYVTRYFNQLLPILAKYQFTKGGPIVAVQVENEYGSTLAPDQNYIRQIYDLLIDNEIVELLFTSDGASSGTSGSLPGVLFQTVNFGSDAAASFTLLEAIQPDKPLMAMEFYPGWFDHWSEAHHTQDSYTFLTNYLEVITYPASVNLYMFHGGTNWGFLNGANIGPGDNSGFQPTTTSYDYDAPLTEAGDYTEKYDVIRFLMEQLNPVQTLIPDPPAIKERQIYPTLTIDKQLTFNDIVPQAPYFIVSPNLLSMEELPINSGSGQSYGYIIYRQTNINLPANSTLTITGHLRDDVMVLVNGVLISKPLSSSDDFNGFGYWRLSQSNMILTSNDLSGATLDLVVENFGRANYGFLYQQFKGFIESNRVFINDEEFTNWLIIPLEFAKSWTNGLGDWKSVDSKELVKGPGLFKATLTLDEVIADYFSDTYIDMTGWNKGIVIVNGFVLGRHVFIGPQQSLYLPGPFLQPGDNEIIIFEQFEPSTEIKFSKDPIFNNP